MRRSLILAVVLATSIAGVASTAPAAAAAAGPSQGSATAVDAARAVGTGAFDLGFGPAVVQAFPTQTPWSLHGHRATLTLIDDRSDHEVDNPLVPGSLLFSEGNRTVQTVDLGTADVRLKGNGDANATLIVTEGAAHDVTSFLDGTFRIAPGNGEVLETSHYVHDGSAFAASVAYDIKAPSGLRLAAQASQTNVSGDFVAYLWGVTIEAGGSLYRTGFYREETVSAYPLHRVSHYVHAFLEVHDGELAMSGAVTAFAQTIRLDSRGQLSLDEATGTMATTKGQVQVSNATVAASGGTYGLTTTATGLRISTWDSPEELEINGIVVRRTDPTLGLVVLAAAALTALVLLALAPTMKGHALRRQGHVPRESGWRSLRAEAYAAWAAQADVQGRPRRAALFAGLAARHLAKDGDARMSYGILLLQIGKNTKAAAELMAAADLFAHAPASGHAGLNAYYASLAFTALGRPDAALAWLQAAVEADPSLAGEAARNPRFGALRMHPDFDAIARAGGS